MPTSEPRASTSICDRRNRGGVCIRTDTERHFQEIAAGKQESWNHLVKIRR